MYVIKKLKLNKFKASPVLTGKQLKAKYGYSEPAVDSNETAENIEVTVPFGARKLQVLSLANDMADKAAEFMNNPDAEPLPFIKPDDR